MLLAVKWDVVNLSLTGGDSRLHADAVPWQQPGKQDHGVLFQDLRPRIPPRTAQWSRHGHVHSRRETRSFIRSRPGSVCMHTADMLTDLSVLVISNDRHLLLNTDILVQ